MPRTAERDAATDATDATDSALDRRLVADVADSVVGLMRTFGRARARMLAAAEHDVEWSSHMLLKTLQLDGPKRAGELASCTQSDPSTVSRQVATLVREGLLERRADPADGRASLLVLTPAADAVLADHAQLRLEHFARVLHDWPDDDLARFAGLLARFTETYERSNADWIAERFAARPAAPPESGNEI